MSDQVREIKQKADIVGIISERLKLRKAGRNFQALCPFHNEKTPSFNVSPELQIYKCFGCGLSGDVYEFLEKFEGMEFAEALRYLADRVGVKLSDFRPSQEYQEKEKLMETLNLAGEFYKFLLMEHKIGEEARAYLRKRGIYRKTAEKFGLGFAPDSWDVLQKYMVGRKKYSIYDLEKVGLVIKRNSKFKMQNAKFYDRFRNRIMFPLKNARGQVVGFSGRLLDVNVKEAKYVNTPETTLYHKSELLYGLAEVKTEIKRADEVIVAEGELDVLSSWQVGVRNIVAIKGSALTEDQARLISRYTKKVLLALDADKAGDAATKRGIVEADKQGLLVRVIEIEGGKDPDELVQTDKSAWKKLARQSVSIYDFYLASGLRRFDVKSGEGKRRISEELVPILAGISNQVEQAHYVNRLAQALGVSEEVIGREIQRRGLGRGMSDEKEEKKEERGGEEPVGEYVLRLLLGSGDKIDERLKRLKLKWFRMKPIKKVAGLMLERGVNLVNNGEVDIEALVGQLPDELKNVAEQAWMKLTQENAGQVSDKEFEGGIKELRKRYLKARLEQISGKIEALEKMKKTKQLEAKINRWQEKFVKISSSLRE